MTTPPLQSSEWLDEIELPLELVHDYKSGDTVILDLTHFPDAKAAILKKFEEAQVRARIDELENTYLKDVHFGCGKNDEEFVRGADPKEQCCYCYPHKSCEMYKGYEALETVIKKRLAELDSLRPQAKDKP